MNTLNTIIKNKFNEYEVRFTTKDKSKFLEVRNFCQKILDNDSVQNNTLYSYINQSTNNLYGKWIEDNIILTSNPPQHRWHCSQCGFARLGVDRSTLEPICPSCGADMRGG